MEPAEILNPPASRGVSAPVLWALAGYCVTFGFSITLSQTSLSLAFLAIVRDIRNGRFKPRWAGVEPAFALMALAGAVSLFTAVDLTHGIKEMSKFLILFVFYVAFWPPLNRKQGIFLLFSLVVGGGVAGVLGLFKTVFIDAELTRSKGFFSMPLTFAETQMFILILASAWLAAGENWKFRRVWVSLALVFSGMGMVASFSRGAFVGLFLAFCLLFRRNLKVLAIAVLCIIIAVSLGVRIRYFSEPGPSPAVSAQDPGNLPDPRFTIWQRGLKIFRIEPVFGVGMNNIKPHYRKLCSPAEILGNTVYGRVYGHLHNNFLQYLVMTGFLGLLAFVWFDIEMFVFLWRLPGRTEDPFLHALLGAGPVLWLAFLMSGMTEYTFGDEEVAMLAFFAAGLLANLAYAPPAPASAPASASAPAPASAPASASLVSP